MRAALHVAALSALAAWLGVLVESAIVLGGGSGHIARPFLVEAFALALGAPFHLVLQLLGIALVLGLRADDRSSRAVRSVRAGLRGDPDASAESLVTITQGTLVCGLFGLGLATAGAIVVDSIVTPGYRKVALAGAGLALLFSAFVIARALGPPARWAIQAGSRRWRRMAVSLLRAEVVGLACAALAAVWLAARVAPQETLQAVGSLLGVVAGLGLTLFCLRRRRLPAWIAPTLLLAIGLGAGLAPSRHAARTEAASRLPSVRATQRIALRRRTVTPGEADRRRVMAPSRVDLPLGTRAPRHVILLSIDALRADRLGCYGYRARPTTPVIDELAKRSALFEDAHAQGTTSLRSIPAVFLSRYPHTVPWVLYRSGRVMPDPAKTRSLAEVLKDAGFQTLAVLHSRYLWTDGLMQGFDEVLSDPAGVDARDDLRAERFVDQTMKYLDESPVADGRLFLWMHFIDPHEPYNAVPGLDWGGTAQQRYDAEVHYVDAQLGRFLAYLERKGIADDALFVLFSDHGEEFGEHGQRFHGRSLNRIATHVPLLFWGEGVHPARHRGTVGLIDVMPTVLNLLSLGARRLHGASLAASVLTGVAPPARTIVSELFPTRVSPPSAWSAERGGWKLLVDRDEEPQALYQTRRDAAERDNEIGQHAVVREAMERDIAVVAALR